MNRFFVRKGGVIPWRQSSDATTPPTPVGRRQIFQVIAKRRAIVARTYGTTADAPVTFKAAWARNANVLIKDSA